MMMWMSKKMGLWMLLSAGTSVVVCAQQRMTPADAARLQQQYSQEMRELQKQMAVSQRESLHVVREPAVVEYEARKAQEAEHAVKMQGQKNKSNPRSAEERAKVAEALKSFNAQLPQMNAALKQASSNSTLPRINLKPMNADDVFSSGGKGASGNALEQQQMNQVIHQHLQAEMKKMDPQSRNQMKAVLKAVEEGKPVPLPQNLPPQQHSKLLPKGSQ